MTNKIDDLLGELISRNASDLHLSSDHPPYLRIDGEISALPGSEALSSDMIRDMLNTIMPERNLAEFEKTGDTDFAHAIGVEARFRVNVFMDRHGVGSVCRLIPTRPPTADQLGLPPAVREFCKLGKGLVVVTGPTGSGKSTTLAAMIDLINSERNDHIITIEDPIEFVHSPKRCLINQREVHQHTRSFASALRAALREDPDIVLVGEMRDLETIEIAIETAETGHLVFGTLHTNTAPTTVNRIIDKFPSDRQNQIRTMLADSLRGVVAQTLCRRKEGGRVAAFEILITTMAVSANIREGKTHQIPSAMQTGRGIGMVTFNDSLLELARSGIITPDEAYRRAIDKDTVRKLLEEARLPGFTPDEPKRPARRMAVTALDSLTRQEDIINTNREILNRNPDDVTSLGVVAWILSTSPNDRLRDGKEAVRMAERAYEITGGQDLTVLDTLAAAYAEARRFEQAVEIMEEARALAERAHIPAVIAAINRQQDLYRKRQPQREC